MPQSTVALIIALVAIICYATEIIPLTMTGIAAMVAMVFVGILTPQEAFNGFCSTAVMLFIGMSIIGQAFLTTGLSYKFGRLIGRSATGGEKGFILLIFVVGGILSAFFNALVATAVLLPLVDTFVMKPGSQITRKHTYLPLAIGSVYGGTLSSIGATSMIAASTLLEQSYYGKGFSFFQPFSVSIFAFAVGFGFYLTIGYRLQKRQFTFDEVPLSPEVVKANREAADADAPINRKMVTVLVVIALCLIGFLFGFNLGAVALAGAVVVIITGCINEKQAIKNVSWSTVIVIAGSIGFSRGLEVSGGGQVIADVIVERCYFLVQSPFALTVLFLFLSTSISNLMSNNAAITIVVPIAIAIAHALGYDPLPTVLACGVGANLSVATPVSTAPVTATLVAGYRFKHYIISGGLVNLLAAIAVSIAFKFVYYS